MAKTKKVAQVAAPKAKGKIDKKAKKAAQEAVKQETKKKVGWDVHGVTPADMSARMFDKTLLARIGRRQGGLQ